MELLNDKVTCANADLKADIERWHINKRKDFRKLFVNMADRQICYFQKVSTMFHFIKILCVFYARKQLLLSAHLSHRNPVHPSVCGTGGVLAIAILSVCLFVTPVDQSKVVQDRITKSSLSAAWKTLASGTVMLFHKFEGGHPE